MDESHMRYLLAAYRPNGADGGDAAFEEALAHAQTDPRLAEWFARQKQFDSAVASTLREIRAPAELRAQILAGASASHTAGRPRAWRTWAMAAVAAASVALMLFTLWQPGRTVRPFDTIIATAYKESQKPLELAFFASSPEELIAWLGENDAPAPASLPAALSALPGIGCRTFSWEGISASLISLEAGDLLSGGDSPVASTVLQLFIVDQSSCSGGAASRVPVVSSRDSGSVATWRDRDHFFVLVAHAPEDALRRLILGQVAIIATR